MPTAIPLTILENIRVASPCEVSWESMTGDERVRRCDQCRMNVYNLSEMSREEATALVAATEGRRCVRFYRRHDGTIMTRDCPVGLALLRAATARVLLRLAAAAGFVLTAFSIMGAGPWNGVRVAGLRPIATVLQWLGQTPPNARHVFMGAMCLPTISAGSAER